MEQFCLLCESLKVTGDDGQLERFHNLRVQTVKLDGHMDVKEILKDGGLWESEGL